MFINYTYWGYVKVQESTKAVDLHLFFSDPDPPAFLNAYPYSDSDAFLIQIGVQLNIFVKKNTERVFCSRKKDCFKVKKNHGAGPNLLWLNNDYYRYQFPCIFKVVKLQFFPPRSGTGSRRENECAALENTCWFIGIFRSGPFSDSSCQSARPWVEVEYACVKPVRSAGSVGNLVLLLVLSRASEPSSASGNSVPGSGAGFRGPHKKN